MPDVDSIWTPTTGGERTKVPSAAQGAALTYRAATIVNDSGGPVYVGNGLGSTPAPDGADWVVPAHGTLVRSIPNVDGLSLYWPGPVEGDDLVAVTLSTDALAGSPQATTPPPRVRTADVIGPGIIFPYAGSGVPVGGFLLCDGAAVSRDTYATLFGVIGTTYGAGDGSTTFNVPDLSARFPLGAGGGHSLGDQGGNASIALGIAEMPTHSHGGATGGAGQHTHTTGKNTASGAQVGSNFSAVRWDGGGSGIPDSTSNPGDHAHGIAAEGLGQPHDNMPPWTAINYVIKT